MNGRFTIGFFVLIIVAVAAYAGVKLDTPEPEYRLLLGKPDEAISAADKFSNLRAAEEALDRAEGDDAAKAAAYLEASLYFEAAGDYKNAAKYAEKAGKKYPQPADAAAALFRSGVMLEKAEKYKDAAKRFEKVYKESLYGRVRADAYGLDINLGEAAIIQACVCREVAGDLKGAKKAYEKYVEEFDAHPARRVWAYYRLGRVLAARGKDDDARSAFNAAVDAYRDSTRNTLLDMEPAVAYYAGATFYREEYDYLEFIETELKLPQDRMERDLNWMLSTSQGLVAAYDEVIELETVEWSVAAYCRLGDTYAYFADALDAAELPKEIDPNRWRKKKSDDPERIEAEEKYDNYMAALEEQTGPLRANATEYYEAAVAIAGALGLTGPWVDRARERYREMTAIE
jgi:tetratricopeptide (TPR) repeat protein